MSDSQTHGISQRTRNGRSVAYSWSAERHAWAATFTDCDFDPRSTYSTYGHIEDLDRAADSFLERRS